MPCCRPGGRPRSVSGTRRGSFRSAPLPSYLGRDQIDEFSDVFELPDLRRRKLDLERLFDGNDQTNVSQTVPAVHVIRRHLRLQDDRVVVEDIGKDTAQLLIDV